MMDENKRLLLRLFQSGGCVRRPNEETRALLGRRYKKGYEIRFALHTKRELTLVRRLLRQFGIPRGKPYAKRTQFVQPVYGRDAVLRLQRLLRTNSCASQS